MGSGNVLHELSSQLAALVESSAPAVVQVVSRHSRPATGTVFASERVLAPAAVVEEGDGSQVRDASGRLHGAELLGADPSSGFAVLEVPGLTVTPPIAGERARPGQLAVSLGRTWSGALAASAGIVSVVGGPLRTGRGRGIEEVLRADVRVHPLGAGGPLIDVEGRATAVATGAMMRGLPLFVPATIAWAIGETISMHGRIRRGYLGVSAQPVRIPAGQRAGLSRETGLLVVALGENAPAEKAGVLVGDLIVGFDGQPIQDHDALLSMLDGDRIGKPASLEIIRGVEARTLQVTVGER